jgi:hypothetical protein
MSCTTWFFYSLKNQQFNFNDTEYMTDELDYWTLFVEYITLAGASNKHDRLQ